MCVLPKIIEFFFENLIQTKRESQPSAVQAMQFESIIWLKNENNVCCCVSKCWTNSLCVLLLLKIFGEKIFPWLIHVKISNHCHYHLFKISTRFNVTLRTVVTVAAKVRKVTGSLNTIERFVF